MAHSKHKVAVVQHPPVLLDLAATLQRAAELIDEAAAQGAKLIAFPETFIPGYPDWVWRTAPTNHGVIDEAFSRLQMNAIDLSAGVLRPLQQAAQRCGITLVCGLNERDGEFGRSTLYNTMVVIGPDGALLNRHRKLMPTNPERMVWGMGDGSGLRVIDTPSGRVGGLICWENYMPLARFALYAQGVEIYVAPTWDEAGNWVASMQHIAKEGRCWVLGCGSALQARDIPQDFPGRSELYPNESEWVNRGDSLIVDPMGKIVAGPLHESCGIVYAECDPAVSRRSRQTFDAVGHYSRPDVFNLTINRQPFRPVAFEDLPTPESASGDGTKAELQLSR